MTVATAEVLRIASEGAGAAIRSCGAARIICSEARMPVAGGPSGCEPTGGEPADGGPMDGGGASEGGAGGGGAGGGGAAASLVGP